MGQKETRAVGEVDVSTQHCDGTVFVNRLKETANNQDCSLLPHMHELSSVHLPKTLFPSMVQHMSTTVCVQPGRPRANPHSRNLSSYQKVALGLSSPTANREPFHLPDCGVINLSLPTGPPNQPVQRALHRSLAGHRYTFGIASRILERNRESRGQKTPVSPPPPPPRPMQRSWYHHKHRRCPPLPITDNVFSPEDLHRYSVGDTTVR